MVLLYACSEGISDAVSEICLQFPENTAVISDLSSPPTENKHEVL